jgi:hypothetical protein
MQYKTWENGVLSVYKAPYQVQKDANGERTGLTTMLLL